MNRDGSLNNTKGFSTSFTRRETMPANSAHGGKLNLTMHTNLSNRNGNNVFRMNTTNLLQNTPQAVDIHKNNFLQ